ncbi:MAG: bifunctional diaminohydroxyphosphoribosylaminopyrimidine deaminase/5-amino-6-(5-phosphoribosylamino)uracil reductase RibD [Flavobacteriales bacterium]|jgi:diaminohydroxyphosphoribosylaminopyrimidine deaminase/5-amino-6-(5-phosphoribosylamino)uracil reductase|nr:bifunctional diaminohydroxyphosphoribosylaminopyrimidine deaminase/5-amino-6-(5-phosphoribosylamino)uracil reductase RibD [Flavobacteriales bacterium]
MAPHDTWMQRALQLARLGTGGVAPNPMVGAVLAQGERILAEGWHKMPGGPHAEVECLHAFGEDPVPADAIMYVTLEPCTHHGRTPPCADLLIARGVKRVVVAHADPFPQVAGQGIQRLRDAGIEVTVGACADEARWTNRRFLTSVQHGRPYIILKWARSADGFLDRHPRDGRNVQRIGSAESDLHVHRWRSEEQAIMVGSNTVINDDPALTVRHVAGRSPLRTVLDRGGRTPAGSQVFNTDAPTLLFTGAPRADVPAEQFVLGPDDDPLPRLMDEWHRRHVRSVLVEGGATLLRQFLQRGLWDEARVIHGTPVFGQGTPAPPLPLMPVRSFASGPDHVHLYLHHGSSTAGTVPHPAWPW